MSSCCGLSLGLLGCFWGHLGREGPVCGPSWAKPRFFRVLASGGLLGPILALLAAPGAPEALLGCSWASPGLPLGRSWALLGGPGRLPGSLLAALGPLLARPWAAPGLCWAVLAASLASFGGSWAALGREKRCVTKPCKNHGFCMVFAWFRAFWGPLGALLAALGWLLGRPQWSWVALGGRPKWPLGAFWVALGRPPWSRKPERSRALVEPVR